MKVKQQKVYERKRKDKTKISGKKIKEKEIMRKLSKIQKTGKETKDKAMTRKNREAQIGHKRIRRGCKGKFRTKLKSNRIIEKTTKEKNGKNMKEKRNDRSKTKNGKERKR